MQQALLTWALATALFLSPLFLGQWGLVGQMLIPGLIAFWAFGLPLTMACGAIGLGFAAALAPMGGMEFSADTLWLIQTAGMSIMLVVAAERRLAGPSSLFALFLYQVLVLGFVYGILAGAFTPAGYQKILSTVSKDLDQSFAAYLQASSAASSVDTKTWLDALKHTLLRFFPGWIGTLILLTAWTNILTAQRLIAARRGEERFGPVFSRWRLPEHLVWAAILAGAGVVFTQDPVKAASENLLVVLGGWYFLQGLAIMFFYFNKFRVPKPIRWLISILICVQLYGLLALAIVGLSDVWLNQRATETPPSEV